MRVFLSGCFLFLSLLAAAQAGQLKGTITAKATGLPVGSCTVTVVKNNAALLSVTADTAGAYRVPVLAPGIYTVVIQATGYENDTLRGVVVSEGKTTYADVKLEPVKIPKKKSRHRKRTKKTTGAMRREESIMNYKC